MDKISYIVRRLLLAVPTFIGITLVCFSLTRFLPGGPVEMRILRMKGAGAAGEVGAVSASAKQVTESYRRELETQFGFDKPIVVQYFNWLVKNKMGLSLTSYEYPNKTAWELISSRLPVSISFGLAAFLLTYLVCIPLGIAKALNHTRPFDSASSFIVFAAYAIPSFALAMLLKTLFCGTVLAGIYFLLAEYQAISITSRHSLNTSPIASAIWFSPFYAMWQALLPCSRFL